MDSRLQAVGTGGDEDLSGLVDRKHPLLDENVAVVGQTGGCRKHLLEQQVDVTGPVRGELPWDRVGTEKRRLDGHGKLVSDSPGDPEQSQLGLGVELWQVTDPSAFTTRIAFPVAQPSPTRAWIAAVSTGSVASHNTAR